MYTFISGITSMSVKDVLTSLVDDGLVDSDKIGTSVYFWAFPSKATQARKRKIESSTENLETVSWLIYVSILTGWSTKNFLVQLKKRLVSAEKAIVEAQKGRVTSDEREKLLTALETEKQENNRLQCRLQEFAENDPEVLEAMAKEATQAVEAANRWTDNIYSIQSWIRKKFPSVEQVSNGRVCQV